MVSSIANNIIKKRNLGYKFGIDESTTNTNLISKHYSPMGMVHVNIPLDIDSNLQLWIGIISDCNLTELESVVNSALVQCLKHKILPSTLQGLRDISGIVSETILTYYSSMKENSVEGIGIVACCNNNYVSSLYGDMMNHLACREEFYHMINITALGGKDENSESKSYKHHNTAHN